LREYLKLDSKARFAANFEVEEGELVDLSPSPVGGRECHSDACAQQTCSVQGGLD